MRRLGVVVLLLAGCVVPKGAGFDDVKKLVAERTREPIHWNQGSDEDRAVGAVVDDLLKKDLTAASATQIALVRNPQLQATYERLGVAQAEVVQAGLLRNPSIGFTIGFPVGATGNIEWEGSIVGSFLDLFLI